MDEALIIRPSRRLLIAGVFLHVMALLAMTLSALPALWWPVAAAGLLVSLWKFAGAQCRPRYTRLRPGDGVARLEGPAGSLGVSPPEVRLMLPGMILLRFRFRRVGHGHQALYLLLASDSFSGEDWRALHRYLGGWSSVSTSG